MNVLCVDGPLRGQVVDMETAGYQVVDPDMSPDLPLDQRSVTYRRNKFAYVSGGEIVYLWMAYSGPEPSALAISDLILSDLAKSVMEASPMEEYPG